MRLEGKKTIGVGRTHRGQHLVFWENQVATCLKCFGSLPESFRCSCRCHYRYEPSNKRLWVQNGGLLVCQHGKCRQGKKVCGLAWNYEKFQKQIEINRSR